jgi:hypothetical protein
VSSGAGGERRSCPLGVVCSTLFTLFRLLIKGAGCTLAAPIKEKEKTRKMKGNNRREKEENP